MSWQDNIDLDEFDLEDGLTVQEVIDAYQDAHWSGQCDPLWCPLCEEEAAAKDGFDIGA